MHDTIGIITQTNGKGGKEGSQTAYQTLPWDWSLKRSIRFSSPQSFDWCSSHLAEAECMGLAMFAGMGSDNANRNSQEESNEEKLNRALLSWSHPEATCPLPPAFVATMPVEARKAIHTHLQVRRQEWQEAFASLYFMLRTNRCPSFYFKLNSQRMVVLFSGPGVAGRGSSETQGHAVIARSTRGLQHFLSENGVKFIMPLWSSKGNQEASGEEAKMLDDLERLNPNRVKRVKETEVVDGEPDSLLFIDGAEPVHALFNLLFNYGVSEQMDDVPLLLAPGPFKHARVSSIKLSCSKTMQAAADSEEFSEAKASIAPAKDKRFVTSYKAECRPTNPIPPWVVWRLAEVFAKSQREYNATFETDPLSNRLNAHFGMADLSNGKRPRWETRPASSVSSVEAKQMAEPPVLKGLCLYKTVCKRGKYVAKLSL